ncbi:hopanoid biosynthesis associated radical SAM protein HpnH, partial [Paraburkholderia sp. SIMBA_049]
GIKTDGPFAPDISIAKQRPAEYVFSRHVEIKLDEIQRAGKGKLQKPAKSATAA